MEYLSLMLGSLATNCYLLKLGDGKCVIVDIGEGAPVLLRRLETEKLTPCAILLTHGHFDHIAGVEQVREKFQIPVYLHALDVPMLSDRNANLAYWISDSPFQAVQAWQTVADGQTLTIAQKDFTLIHTPGHTRKRLLEMRGSAADGGHAVPYVTWQNGFSRRKRCPDAGIFPKTQGAGGGLPCTAGTQRGIHALL